MIRLMTIVAVLIAISGCGRTTGYAVGASHAFDSNEGSIYHSPHFKRKGEKVDMGIKYYYFEDRTDDPDYMKVDWDYKF